MAPVSPVESAHAAARLTARVDSARPGNDSTQNGPTSPSIERVPVVRHTHRRLSSNDGNGADRGGDHVGDARRACVVVTSTPSTVRLVAVATIETVP